MYWIDAVKAAESLDPHLLTASCPNNLIGFFCDIVE